MTTRCPLFDRALALGSKMGWNTPSGVVDPRIFELDPPAKLESFDRILLSTMPGITLFHKIPNNVGRSGYSVWASHDEYLFFETEIIAADSGREMKTPFFVQPQTHLSLGSFLSFETSRTGGATTTAQCVGLIEPIATAEFSFVHFSFSNVL